MKMSIGSYTGLASGCRQCAYTCQHAIFYPNAYLTFNANGEYTKHYYSCNERIANCLGENTIDITLNNTNSVQFYNTITKVYSH